MYIALVLYLATYAFSAYKIWTLSKIAIYQTQVASLKALNAYVDSVETSTYSDSLYGKLYADIDLLYDAVRLGAKKSCTLNMLYLCPMVLFFCITNGSEFAESYVNEYKSEILPDLESALQETSLLGSSVEEIIRKTSEYLNEDTDSLG